MSIFTIKQGYIVKSVLIISFLFVMSLGLIGGCSDDNNSINAAALTENDFAENSSLKADLEDGVIVTFLESPVSEEVENDTGEVGEDKIPVTFEEITEQTFCWEDEDPDAMHFMELRDSEGNLILTVEVNGDCVTQVIEAGDYSLSIHHDGSNEDSLPIFLIPDPEELEESEQARKIKGLIDRLKVVASNIRNLIESTVSADAQAQTQAAINNTNTLLSTNSCVRCNLHDANLRGANLTDANLRFARLARADLTDANLTRARLFETSFRDAEMIATNLSGAQAEKAGFWGAEMIDADFRGARLGTNMAFRIGASFTNADLTGADFRNAHCRAVIFERTVLTDADFRGANCARADFVNANLTRVNFTGTDLTDANFRNATWCDGTCRCANVPPFGVCTGCAPVSICNGF